MWNVTERWSLHQTDSLPCLLITVLVKYDLVEFVSIVDSIRKGNLREFNDALIKYQHRFIWYVQKAVGTCASTVVGFSLACSTQPRNLSPARKMQDSLLPQLIQAHTFGDWKTTGIVGSCGQRVQVAGHPQHGSGRNGMHLGQSHLHWLHSRVSLTQQTNSCP